MAEHTLFIKDENGWQALAEKLAPHLKTGDVITLEGDLGAGKTSFARALIRTLADNPAQDVPSPTFTLVQTYELPRLSVWHFDLYRLEEKELDILELGWDDARREGLCLVEWPARLGKLLPKDRLAVKIAYASGGGRQATLAAYGIWSARLPSFM